MARAHVFLLSSTLLALCATMASAEPKFLSKQYPRCTSCHYSPTGGGLLTTYRPFAVASGVVDVRRTDAVARRCRAARHDQSRARRGVVSLGRLRQVAGRAAAGDRNAALVPALLVFERQRRSQPADERRPPRGLSIQGLDLLRSGRPRAPGRRPVLARLVGILDRASAGRRASDSALAASCRRTGFASPITRRTTANSWVSRNTIRSSAWK